MKRVNQAVLGVKGAGQDSILVHMLIRYEIKLVVVSADLEPACSAFHFEPHVVLYLPLPIPIAPAQSSSFVPSCALEEERGRWGRWLACQVVWQQEHRPHSQGVTDSSPGSGGTGRAPCLFLHVLLRLRRTGQWLPGSSVSVCPWMMELTATHGGRWVRNEAFGTLVIFAPRAHAPRPTIVTVLTVQKQWVGNVVSHLITMRQDGRNEGQSHGVQPLLLPKSPKLAPGITTAASCSSGTQQLVRWIGMASNSNCYHGSLVRPPFSSVQQWVLSTLSIKWWQLLVCLSFPAWPYHWAGGSNEEDGPLLLVHLPDVSEMA